MCFVCFVLSSCYDVHFMYYYHVSLFFIMYLCMLMSFPCMFMYLFFVSFLYVFTVFITLIMSCHFKAECVVKLKSEYRFSKVRTTIEQNREALGIKK